MEVKQQKMVADLFEQAVDAFPDREYLVVGDQRRTYAQMEERANRLAHDLAAHGIGVGDHVGEGLAVGVGVCVLARVVVGDGEGLAVFVGVGVALLDGNGVYVGVDDGEGRGIAVWLTGP